MAQGLGFWYNPKTNITVEVSRHETEIKDKNSQNILDLSPMAIDALEELIINPKNEDKIKIIAVRSGLVRIRDWNQFLSIQLYAKGNKLKDILFSLGELIEGYREKDNRYKKITPSTKEFAKLLSTSWVLKIDNIATNSHEKISPNEFLKKYMDEGFLEERNEEMKNENREIRDIPMDNDLLREAEELLRKHGFFDNPQNELFEELKLHEVILKEERLQEDATLSRIWQMVNDGKHIFSIITGHRATEAEDQWKINKQRNKVLESILKRLGYGFNKVTGYWTEFGQNNKTGDVFKDKEESYIVSTEIPESELEKGKYGSTAKAFMNNMLDLMEGGKNEDDNKVPNEQEVLRNKSGFNQDAIVIKPDPNEKNIKLVWNKKIGYDDKDFKNVEFFSDIKKEIDKLPVERIEKIKADDGGVSFTEIPKKKKFFRFGKLKGNENE